MSTETAPPSDVTIRKDIRWVYDPTETELRWFLEELRPSKYDPNAVEFFRTGLVQWMPK